MRVEYILIMLSITFLLFAGFCIPFLLQILRTAKSMDTTLRMFNQNLPGIMKNLEEITTKVNQTTTMVQRQVEELSTSVRKIQGTLGLIVGMEEIIRRGIGLRFADTLRTSFAVAKGVRVFLDHLLTERLARQKTDGKGEYSD
jgi:predicted PurR-regulated permease PerM